MGVEIEHKYLVRDDSWKRAAGSGRYYRQGYLAATPDSGIRVSLEGDNAFLTIKKAQSLLRRLEFEYPIPRDDAEALLRLCADAHLEKTRYRVPHDGHVWEVDVFAGGNSGLVVAEIELGDEGEAFSLPDWVGQEVSADTRYYAMNLAKAPWSTW